MIISYQLGKFCFTEFDQDWNEHSQIWKIADFYTDFPFLPQLDFQEVSSISFEDDRDLYLITFKHTPTVGGYTTPEIHPFLQSLQDNKATIKARAYELMAPVEPEDPGPSLESQLSAANTKIADLESVIDAILGEV